MRAKLVGGPNDGAVHDDVLGTPILRTPADFASLEEALKADTITVLVYKRQPLTELDQAEADYFHEGSDPPLSVAPHA